MENLKGNGVSAARARHPNPGRAGATTVFKRWPPPSLLEVDRSACAFDAARSVCNAAEHIVHDQGRIVAGMIQARQAERRL